MDRARLRTVTGHRRGTIGLAVACLGAVALAGGAVAVGNGVMAAHAASARSAAAPPSDAPRAQLRGLIENVTGAAARRYHAVDSAGRGMDTAKLVQEGAGRYLAVYHTLLGDGRFHAAIATSTDLMNWTFAHDFGAGSSQPTIAATAGGGWVLAWEQDPANHIAVRFYADRAALLAGSAARSFDAPRRLSSCAEGTPNIYSVTLNPDITHSTIDLGGHYFANCDADRQLRATLTNFSTWSVSAQPLYDNALLYWGVKGNIGDRDAATFQGYPYAVIEGQYVKGDFGSWRTFVYDHSTGNADTLAIRTDRGSAAFANPSMTVLQTPGGQQALLVSLFLPSEAAASGEAGQLLYYSTF